MSRPKLTYSNVVSTIALVGVLAGGGAYAASKIGPGDIKKNAVQAKHIKKKAVKRTKLAPDAKPMWAAVDDGTILAQSGGISFRGTAPTGVRVIAFPRRVQRRAIVATAISSIQLGDSLASRTGAKASPCGAGPIPGAGACTSAGDNAPNQAQVTTYDEGGINADLPFFVVALP